MARAGLAAKMDDVLCGSTHDRDMDTATSTASTTSLLRALAVDDEKAAGASHAAMSPPLEDDRACLLSLPLEIRLCIYRHALIKPRRMTVPLYGRSMVENLIVPSFREEPLDGTPMPNLIRTSKQIYREAVSILYSGNAFMADHAGQFLDFLRQIGPANVASLRSLRIAPSAAYCETEISRWGGPPDPDYLSTTWCELLNKLADEATGLRHVSVYFDTAVEIDMFGAGRDVAFVRALARMKISGRLKLEGYFAAPWPRYLEEALGKPVWDARDHKKPYLEELAAFQQGTESLIP